MSLRGRLDRLRRAAEVELITIPQQDGSVRKFPPDAAKDAYVNVCARLRAAYRGDEVPPEHPLLEAARNSSDPRWSRSFFAADGATGEHVEDLWE